MLKKFYLCVGDIFLSLIFLGGIIFLDDVIDFMIKKNLSISCAESCTGGLLSAKFISYAGISKIFYEGIVAYNNNAKIKRLSVDESKLEIYGAVSTEIAIEMLKNLGTDICISTTGVAGPNQDDFKNPVGLVYIGLKVKNDIIDVKKCNFSGTRLEIQNKTVDMALNFLREKLFSIKI